jgi:hypothetical protein
MQGKWQADASVVGACGILLLLVHGGSMSTSTKKLLTIAAVGAIGAVLIDGFVRPNVGA